MAERRNWTQDELRLALYLYFQLPFGKLHSRQPDIIKLAARIDRTPSAVAMKLVNFASLDPKIVATGRSGLGNASALDREAWDHFTKDWDASVAQAALDMAGDELGPRTGSVNEQPEPFGSFPAGSPTTQIGTVTLRVGQGFFRNSVLANFDSVCCVSGIADRRLLVASHIRPWRVDAANRLNPANGLCLSGTLDRAFDAGLMTVSSSHTCSISERLLNHSSAKTRAFFAQYEGQALGKAQKVPLLEEALDWHRTHLFNSGEVSDEHATDIPLS